MSEFWQHLKIVDSINWVSVGATAIHVVVIFALAYGLTRLFRRLLSLFRRRITSHMDNIEQVRRVETLVRVFRYVTTVLVSLIAGMLILSEIGVSIAPILGAAGVVGLAVGFGAQSLIKDYFTGFFLLLENQIRQGDVVDAGGKSGTVEEVTLRYVRLRDYDGIVHFIPNNLITTVSNMSRGFAFAVVDAGVAYREDVDHVMRVMQRVAAELRKDEVFAPKIIADLEMAGVDKWAESSVIVRCRLRVLPLEQWNVRREFLRRLKKAFDEEGIEIPFPHLTVYPGQLKDGSAPALRVEGPSTSGE
ncbi:MAG TPA: mechanosensitive ion channel domain-containing protein [Burkholderiales bacterium]|nr:mechanosensitive ion channel domain-containing protein [Burkholderiales bacterium]